MEGTNKKAIDLSGLNVFKQQIENEIDKQIVVHNADLSAHSSLRDEIQALKERILAIEIDNGAEVTENAFSVTFTSLDGVSASGIYNDAEKRLEF